MLGCAPGRQQSGIAWVRVAVYPMTSTISVTTASVLAEV